MSNSVWRLLTVTTLALLSCARLSTAAADSPAPRPRAALVIGNAGYTAVNPLKNAAADAHDMCDALGDLGYKTSCFIDVGSAHEFKARIQDFAASLKPKSEVLLYYAGHAVQVRGENYLVPTDARLRTEADVARETISLKYIMSQLVQAKHYVNIVILDACRSNPWADTDRGLTAGLAPITAIPRGTMIMYATASNAVSDDGEGRNGTLTKHLLANIKVPGLTVDEFFKRVSDGVQADSLAAINYAQTPALYTNFTGDFCFAGCIDKVARAELDRMRKSDEEELEQLRHEKLQAEADKRDAEAKLASAVTSMKCDKSGLPGSGQCFAAPPDRTLRAIAQALLQQGYRIRDGSIARGVVEGERSQDNQQDKSLTDVLTADATVQAVPVTGQSVVTITATRRTVLHDEYQKWGNVSGLIPLPTSKEYQDVVKKEVTIDDAAFYDELFAAIDRNLRSDNVATTAAAAPGAAPAAAAAADTPDSPSATSVPVSVELPTSPRPPKISAANASSGHQHQFDAPWDRTEHALLEVLVSRGYVVDTIKPEFGLINANNKTPSLKDDRLSIHTDLSASVIASGKGSQIQMSASAQKIVHRKPGSRVAGALLGYEPHDYRTVVKDDNAVEDPAFYSDLFAAVERTLAGKEALPPARSHRFSGSLTRSVRAAVDSFAEQGFSIVRTDEKLGLVTAARRTETPSENDDGWTASYVHASIYVGSTDTSDVVFVASASVQEALFRVSKHYSFSPQQMKDQTAQRMQEINCQDCPAEETRAAMLLLINSPTNQEVVTRESDIDAAFYAKTFTIINRKMADTAITSVSAQ